MPKSSRPGILTLHEREYLKGNSELSRKKRSEFFSELLERIHECCIDLTILGEAKQNESLSHFQAWLALHWLEITQLLDLTKSFIRPSEFRAFTPGKVKSHLVILDGKKRRAYWFDRKDNSRPELEKLFNDDHVLRGIKGKSARIVLRQAMKDFREQATLEYAPPSPFTWVMSKREDSPLVIEEIKRRTTMWNEKKRGWESNPKQP